MAKKLKVRSRSLLIGHGMLMLSLGMALFFLSTLISDPHFEKIGYVAANALTAACLLIPASVFTVFAKRLRHPRPMVVYLSVCALSIACWVTFWFVQFSPVDVPSLALLAGLHGVFWSLWYVRLALNFKGYPVKATLLSILAASMPFLGAILATQAELSPVRAVTMVAGYAMYIGISTLSMTVYLFRECADEAELPAAEPVQHGIRQVPARVFAETESMAS